MVTVSTGTITPTFIARRPEAMLDALTEPWASNLVRGALVQTVLVSVLCGVVGVFIEVKGLAFTTEALTHIAFPGAVIAAAAGGSIIVGGLIAAIVGALAIALATRAPHTSDETAIGVVFTGAFGVGALLAVVLGPLDRDVSSFLFGSLFGVSTADLVTTSVAALMIAITLVVVRRPLIAAAFDAESAGSGGHVRGIEAIFLVVVALTVVVAARAVGNVLAVALLVIPAATARLLCRRLSATLLVAAGVGATAAVGGIYLSYYAGVAAGGSVVLVATALLLIALISSRLPRRREAGTSTLPATPVHT